MPDLPDTAPTAAHPEGSDTPGTGAAGRTVLLAGASSALGTRLARSLGEAGARVVAVARREIPELDGLERVTTLRADLTDPAAVAALVASVHDGVGPVDAVLPLVGGWRGGGGIAGQSEADFRFLEASLTTLRLTTTAFWDDLVASPAGRVAIVSSTTVATPRAGNASYGALKAAAEFWTGALAHGFTTTAATGPDGEVRGAAVVLRVRAVEGLEDRLTEAVLGLWDSPAATLNGSTRTLQQGE
ncbi:alcohol dehydrogenase [Serinibacter arcticus]|uniref:Alcohol dehydrogenase n=1 Tax=Serinibacter arcticus TaxID=1655435 RepID=A0A2U1ZSI5_9MICO|nr:SDR family NAD(P)-dependent oxidoreductase [Serinibacter arcticus]PWD49947.1 alcohol dehydrogenase [Serinibacter arcticus]